MKRRVFWPGLTLLALALAAVLALFLAPRGRLCAEIYVDGALLTTVDLQNVPAPYELPIGGGNIALVEQGRISMSWADCPDQCCVHMGCTSSAARPIVCLPNRVSIVVGGTAAAEMDAVTG